MTDLLIDPYPPQDSRSEAPSRRLAQVEALFRSHGPWLARVLARRTDREEAKDLVQEAFLRLTRAAEHQALDNPEAYLKRIAWNLLRDRAKNATGRIERAHAPLQPDLHAANDSDPHQALVERQTLARYEAAVMRLKPKTREIFLLHRLDGLTYAQIARDLGMSVSGVEKQMIKAIAHLDRALSKV
ncbi:RNA polymerase sigma factor, sigma-70 family [Caulobacter sp. AP07]|uniref:RNA polymerase sigma factor n=1 Tax=Caulobacter sp. AP07 TaxID=1144304 RepID=UPI000271ED4E|nr:RNA polymerase sigma factor [Caulobacter sp. AP07]EJL37548.1 RNA polymerase sigma factor, sigma-70 family [Caulobacter sp. AP07]